MTDIQKNKEESEELTFAERLNIQPVRKQCVCGKSKKYPFCDGTHNVA